MIASVKVSRPFLFAVRTMGSQLRLGICRYVPKFGDRNRFCMNPKALRRSGGLSALADTKHAVAAPLPYRGAAILYSTFFRRGKKVEKKKLQKTTISCKIPSKIATIYIDIPSQKYIQISGFKYG